MNDHPAVEAWRRASGTLAPLAPEVLQVESRRSVYRLRGAGPAGETVIAKCSNRTEIAAEVHVYEQVLPRLPIATVALLGRADTPDGRSWLFLQEATGATFDGDLPEHRALAGATLAKLHVAGARMVRTEGHADRSAAGFHGHLAPAMQRLADALATNPALGPEHRAVLDEVLQQCRGFAAEWPALARASAECPTTVVHGDFKEDNLRVRPGPDGLELVLFDWERAGTGPAALDLAKFLGYSIRPDLDAYCAIARQAWPELTVDAVLRAAHIGEVFRWLATVRWEAERLVGPWLEKPMSRFAVYRAWGRELLGAAPWAEPWSVAAIRADLVVPRSWY